MDNNSQFAINVSGLSKSFNGKPAVIEAALQVRVGEIFGFLGPNGGGKTTTIRMLCGLLTPDAGSGNCLGFDIIKQSENIKLQIGYMTQAFSLYEELTIFENLDFMAHLYAVPNRHEVVNKAIAELGLTARANQLAGTLSGGWKQRLSLTAALLHNPKLLLLDEPTAGVDPKARREFWDHIHYLSTQGITTLVSTHYMDEAERCHRLGYIFQGRILVQGTKEDIIKHANLTTWELRGDDVANLVPEIKKLPGVEQVAAFGNALHVSGRNSKLLCDSMLTCKGGNYQCLQISPSLEDVFISLGTADVG
ncbi:MAG: ABC transporter ATP-binding protein [Gammaproteobacteria bacterium]|nr:ABC transporter ATP-binding protein [Gammaproteobacteria bacterium]